MKQIYVLMRFVSGRMLVVIDYSYVAVITPEQYANFLKRYPQ